MKKRSQYDSNFPGRTDLQLPEIERECSACGYRSKTGGTDDTGGCPICGYSHEQNYSLQSVGKYTAQLFQQGITTEAIEGLKQMLKDQGLDDADIDELSKTLEQKNLPSESQDPQVSLTPQTTMQTVQKPGIPLTTISKVSAKEVMKKENAVYDQIKMCAFGLCEADYNEFSNLVEDLAEGYLSSGFGFDESKLLAEKDAAEQFGIDLD